VILPYVANESEFYNFYNNISNKVEEYWIIY